MFLFGSSISAPTHSRIVAALFLVLLLRARSRIMVFIPVLDGAKKTIDGSAIIVLPDAVIIVADHDGASATMLRDDMPLTLRWHWSTENDADIVAIRCLS